MYSKTMRIAAATVLTAGLGAVAPAVAATPAQGVGVRAAVTPQSGFSVVRRTAADALAMASPTAGQLWIAERSDDGRVLLERLNRGRWTSTTLDVGANGVQLATEEGQTTLVSNGRLFVTDDDQWDEVPLPTASGSRVQAVTATPGPDGDLYVGATGSMRGGSAVYRYDGRRWTSLGNPSSSSSRMTPLQLRIAQGDLLTRWRDETSGQESVWHRDDAGWEKQYDTTNERPYPYRATGAWLVRDLDHQLVLGGSNYWSSGYSTCLRWNAPQRTDCSTGHRVGGAAVRADGQTVIGSEYHSDFRLRDANGSEQMLTGSTGGRTVAIESEPGTHTVWAVTGYGNNTTLQRYVW